MPVLEEGLVYHRFTSAASDLQPQAKESTLDPQPGGELGHQGSVSGQTSLTFLKMKENYETGTLDDG